MHHTTRFQGLRWAPFLLVAALAAEATTDQASPPNIVASTAFPVLMKVMHRDIVRCGVPRTAVLRWHVLPNGEINDFVLHKSSGDACFDGIVMLNAEDIIKAKVRVTPATRNGVAEAAWVPFAVAARD